jgi:chemotaxis signal transduction protein
MSKESSRESVEGLIDEAARREDAGFDWEDLGVVTQGTEIISVLRFGMQGLSYAVRGADVSEVMRAPKLTPLPGAPPYVMGIVLHRRQVVGVLDLNVWLGLATPHEATISTSSRLILVEHGTFLVALYAEQVATVEHWELDRTHAIPTGLPERIRRYAELAHEVDGQLVPLLHIKKIVEEAAVRG